MPAVLFFVFLIIAMWVAVVMPQQRRQRAHQQVVAALEVGQEVMTTAGVYGTITALEGDIASLEIAPGVDIRIARQAILRPVVEPDPMFDEGGDQVDSGDEPGFDHLAAPDDEHDMAGAGPDRIADLPDEDR